MNFNVHDVYDLLYSHQPVSAAIAAIFRVMLLVQEYKGTNVVRLCHCHSITIQN
jgi:hypothetical protein